MTRRTPDDTAAQFAKDIAEHQMTVVRDNGVDRHLRFKAPDCNAYWFDVITWAGRLYIGGDCGAWVFTRVPDMFKFFRSDKGRINPGYWAEKLEATPDKGATEFSEDRFREVINEYRVQWVRNAAREGRLTKAQRRELWEEVDGRVFGALGDHGEHGAFQAAYDFRWKPEGASRRAWSFDDLWDHNFNEHTSRYLWNCHAIVWAIQRYDAYKAAEAEREANSSLETSEACAA